MRQRIRFLERKLIKELTEIKVEPVVEQIVSEWPDLDENPDADLKDAPDGLELLARLTAACVFLPKMEGAINYLDQCRPNRTRPTYKHIINRLLPWLSRTPIPYGYTN